jgi:peptide deformylase
MLKLIKPKKNTIADPVTFDQAFKNQKDAVSMVMCMNLNNMNLLVGPQCGLDKQILVVNEKPDMLFNPSAILVKDHNTVPKEFTFTKNDSIIYIKYQDYRGSEKSIHKVDNDGLWLAAITELSKTQ